MVEKYQKGEFEKDFSAFEYLELFGKLPEKKKSKFDWFYNENYLF